MIDTVLVEGKRAGFATVEAFGEKVERREYERFTDYRASHGVTLDQVTIRAFRDSGDPLGIMLPRPDAASIRRAFHDLGAVNIPDKKPNHAEHLPPSVRRSRVVIYDAEIERDGDARFDSLVERIAEIPVLYPGLTLEKIAFGQSLRKIYLANSRGLRTKYRKTIFDLKLTLSLQGNVIEINETSTHFNGLNPSRLTTRAYNLLNSLTDETTVDPGISFFLFSPEAATVLLREFSGHFKAGETHPAGRIQFPAALTLVDRPLLDFQPGSAPCDDEGVQTGDTLLVDKGVWVGSISDLRTASRFGISSSGNGFRREPDIFPEVEFSNLCIKPSVMALKKVMDEAGRGILVSLIKPKLVEKGKSLFSAYGYHFSGNELRQPVHLYFSTDFLSFFMGVGRVTREMRFFHGHINVGSPYLLVAVHRERDGSFLI